MTRFLLDTNVVSSLIRERSASPVYARIAVVGPEAVCTSIIVVSEILYGVAKCGSKRLAVEAERVLCSLTCLSLEPPVDRIYATTRAAMERTGRLIGGNDLLIAAHCLALNATLVTHNTREFQRVPGLRIEDWLQR